MSLISRLVLITAVLGAALIGCKKDKDEAATAPVLDAAAAPKAPDAAAAAAAVDAAPAAAAPSDAQILAIVTAANAADADAGKLAKSKSKNGEVKKFADMMIKDHTSMNKDGAALAKKIGVTPEDSETSEKLKADAQAAADKLGALAGAEFDKAYIAEEITVHQNVLDALDTMLIPNAKNPDLKAQLEVAKAKVQAHLDHAKALQPKLK